MFVTYKSFSSLFEYFITSSLILGNHQRIQIFHNGTLAIQQTKTSDRGEYICEIATVGFEPILSKPATISVIGN